ncbi:MAG: 3-deoxy-7-phosphoheptulonate synthase [candidate division Zixibacteria bacterium]|nr:3-deoxy-7-phosphoheptulonate synthase [candidate division Zixibacteria bacterium]MBU1469330.1 3-deoxy-7-phosphoheptulonate synthase [candidate division Zixibacteria bacterium]MBU2626390.1 3-deoxy-7-phosphoheptulonate synthase [candidate division Zixibacteria bacterium]
MIYSFEKTDPVKTDFLGVLRQHDVDFELIDHDRSVVRILGSVQNGIGEKLAEVYGGRRRLTVTKEPLDNIYSDFKDRSRISLIAGPCSVESEEQLASIASFIRSKGLRYIRGGAYKPRTSPDSFQGMGMPGLRIISTAAKAAGLKVVSEVMDRSQIDTLVEHADIIQIGSRNMFNYTLLTALGSIDKPVLLKRGMAATVDEWLKAAEYISRGGNNSIILCERGIRTFEPRTRNTLDIAAIHLAKQLSDYPVIADPSHAAGHRDIVIPLAVAAVASGADGIMVEIHPEPDSALSDRDQALSFDRFEKLLQRLDDLHISHK